MLLFKRSAPCLSGFTQRGICFVRAVSSGLSSSPVFDLDFYEFKNTFCPNFRETQNLRVNGKIVESQESKFLVLQ